MSVSRSVGTPLLTKPLPLARISIRLARGAEAEVLLHGELPLHGHLALLFLSDSDGKTDTGRENETTYTPPPQKKEQLGHSLRMAIASGWL